MRSTWLALQSLDSETWATFRKTISIIFVSSQYQIIHKWNNAVWTTDNFIASTKKLSSLTKIIKWHAHVVHIFKHMKMMGGAFLLGRPRPAPPKSGAVLLIHLFRRKLLSKTSSIAAFIDHKFIFYGKVVANALEKFEFKNPWLPWTSTIPTWKNLTHSPLFLQRHHPGKLFLFRFLIVNGLFIWCEPGPAYILILFAQDMITPWDTQSRNSHACCVANWQPCSFFWGFC